MSLSAEDRLWAKVDRSGDCWVWIGGTSAPGGYGRLWIGRRAVLAHRFAWELAFGRPPDELDVLHRCDNPPCCNPEHLYLGTHQDNMRDRQERGRSRGPSFKGERHPMAKLSDAQARAIIEAREQGERGRVLAARYGVSEATVSRIVHGQRMSER